MEVYLDNNATTIVDPKVYEEMKPFFCDIYGNPNSLHKFGAGTHPKMVEALNFLYEGINAADEDDVIITANATESNNTVLKGIWIDKILNGDKKHIITSEVEHPSITAVCKFLETQGVSVTYLPVNEEGVLEASLVREYIKEETALVSIMWANNETGKIFPIKEIGAICKEFGVPFHTDGTQAIGKIPVDVQEYNVDYLSFSAHKFHGPKGVGFLYHGDLKFDNLIHGGEQENGRRAGTESIHNIVGMATALEISAQHLDTNYDKVSALKTQLLSELDGLDYYVNAFGETMPHVLNLGFPGFNQDLLLMKLDLQGIAISTGSACTAGVIEPSHVLEAVYGKTSAKLKESVRVSLSDLTTSEDISEFVRILKSILAQK